MLDDCYGTDYVHAESVFAMLLEELPSNLTDLYQLLEQHNLADFKKYIHKIKPTFNYVGLTTLSHDLQLLENRCGSIQSLAEAKDEIRDMLERIEKAVPLLKNEVERLRQYNNNGYED